MPRVSIIIPTFNCARFLGRALETAFAQTYPDYEVIVVDDGSIDDTQAVVDRWDGKVRYFYQSNRGLSSARNLGLYKACGELVAYLDADDMWYPHKLETEVAFLDSHSGFGLVHSDAAIIDETDRIIHARFNKETQRRVPQGDCMMDLLRRCHILVLTVLERRDLFEKAGRFDERLKSVEDYLHWILLAMEGTRFGYIDEPLALYRRRKGSLSGNERGMLKAYEKLFMILLTEKGLALRCGQDAANIVNTRLHAVRRDLVYLDRVEGRMSEARRGAARLIWESPGQLPCYLELLKSCVPFSLATQMRRVRRRTA